MTQLTAAISAVDQKVEVSTNGSSWTDISGAASIVTIEPQERGVGSAFTFDGDGALLTYGKKQPVSITVTLVYSEGTGDAFEFVRAVHETVDGGAFYLRISPQGGAAGEAQYSTGSCKLASFQYPSGDASSADPIMTTFSCIASAITRSLVGA